MRNMMLLMLFYIPVVGIAACEGPPGPMGPVGQPETLTIKLTDDLWDATEESFVIEDKRFDAQVITQVYLQRFHMKDGEAYLVPFDAFTAWSRGSVYRLLKPGTLYLHGPYDDLVGVEVIIILGAG